MGKAAFLSSPLEVVPPNKPPLHTPEKAVWNPGSPKTELQSPASFGNFWPLPLWPSLVCSAKRYENINFAKWGPDTFFDTEGIKKDHGWIIIRAGTSYSNGKRHPDLNCVLSLIRIIEMPSEGYMVQVIEMDLVYWAENNVCVLSFWGLYISPTAF